MAGTEGLPNPIGKIPSPYGTMIDVYFDRSRHVDEDECYFHDMNGCMDVAGVYGDENRKKCFEAIKKSAPSGKVKMQIFLDHGGHTVPKVALPKAEESVYKRFAFPSEVQHVIENWVDIALETSNWTERAARLIDPGITQALASSRDWSLPVDIRDTVISLSLGHMITSSLEHLNEPEIDCIEAAAIYSLTLHEGWRAAGIEWLQPFRKTWFKDWKRDKPVYREAATIIRAVDTDVPSWLAA